MAGTGPAAVDTADSVGEVGRCTSDGGGKPEKEGMVGWRPWCTYTLGVRPAESICVGVGEDVGVGQQAGEGGRYTDECAPRGGRKVDALPGLRRDVQRIVRIRLATIKPSWARCGGTSAVADSVEVVTVEVKNGVLDGRVKSNSLMTFRQ